MRRMLLFLFICFALLGCATIRHETQGNRFFNGSSRKDFLENALWIKQQSGAITSASAIVQFGNSHVIEERENVLGMAWYFFDRKSYELDAAVLKKTNGNEQLYVLSMTFVRITEDAPPALAAYALHTENIPFSNSSFSTKPLVYAGAAYIAVSVARTEITKLVNKTSADIAQDVLDKEKDLLQPKKPAK